MSELSWVLFGGYALALLSMWWRWRRSSPYSVGSISGTVAVLVPARNEAHNLPALLADLAAQAASAPAFEVWVIDDHSEDGTAAVVTQFTRPGFAPRYLALPAGHTGKKAALAAGIAACGADWVVTVDADCRVGEHWLASLLAPAQQSQVQAIAGPVAYEPGRGLFQALQQLEFASLIGVGGATALWGRPTMVNGANLAFRRQAWEAVGGYCSHEQMASGDDEFLVHALHQTYGRGAVAFVPHGAATVTTAGAPHWSAFVHQRLRWATKWRHYQNRRMPLLAIGVFFFHLWILVGAALSAVHLIAPEAFWGGFALKMMVELLFLRQILHRLQQPFPWLAFLLWQGLYSLYAVGFGLAVQRKSYSWKGRRYTT